jgi:hypothetical protein
METEDDGWKPNHWHDILLKSIEDDIASGKIDKDIFELFGESYNKPALEKSNFIKLANPEKLARDYALMSGDSVKIIYKSETTVAYNYDFKIRTKPANPGLISIYKQKIDGKAYVEFLFGDFSAESKSYEMSEFTDFQNFMGKIIDVIVKR